MKKYIDAELQIVRLSNRDIVTESLHSSAILDSDATLHFYSNEVTEGL